MHRILKYNFGISQLDEHHRHLIDLINTAYNCSLDSTNESNLDDLLIELSSYTRFHFSAEEQLMKCHDFPEDLANAHISEHNLFNRQLEQFHQDIRGSKAVLAADMMKFLISWMINHVVDVDKQLCRYLTDKGVA